jgi:hypothetical protein
VSADRWAVLAALANPPSWRVRKVGAVWLVMDLENPGEFLRGPVFKRKRDAVQFAALNAGAIWDRLREDGR